MLTKDRVFQAVLRSILHNGGKMWPVFENDGFHRILHVRRRDCAPTVERRRHLSLTSTLALLVQRRLRWFGHVARRPEGELIKDLLLPTPPRTWRIRAGGQLKTWATTVKAEPRIFGHARWRKD